MFKDRLAEILKDKKISQAELARGINCGRQMVSDWLAGKSSPRHTNLVKIAAFLDVTLGELLLDEAKSQGLTLKEVDNVIPVPMSEECREMVNLYNDLKPRDKLNLLNYAYILSGHNVDPEDGSDDHYEETVISKMEK